MSERDELADILKSPESFDGGPASSGPNAVYAARTADAILAAGYRRYQVALTVEDLRAVLEGSLIMTGDGRAVRFGIGASGMDSDYLISLLPATVLYEPEPTP